MAFAMWAVFTPKNRIIPSTINVRRIHALDAAESYFVDEWRYLYRKGYRCRPVTVSYSNRRK